MSAEPFFSVVIPTFNRAVSVKSAVESVLAQSYSDFELVVVDDGSTDGTRSLITAITDPRIRYLFQENQGVSVARNTGLFAATGSVVVFLDSDDLACPEWLAEFQGVFSKPGVGVACCGAMRVDGDGRLFAALPRDMGRMFDHTVGLFLAGTFAARRELLLAIGGYVPELLGSENTEIALRLIGACNAYGMKLQAVAQPLIRFHENRAVRRGGDERFLQGAQYMLANHGVSLRKDSRTHASYYAIVGVELKRMGRMDEARPYFWRAARTFPGAWKHWVRLLDALLPRVGQR